MCEEFHKLKHTLNVDGDGLEVFHATEDKQVVRDQVYNILNNNDFEIDSVIVEKAKTHPSLRNNVQFYTRFDSALLQYILNRYDENRIGKIIIYLSKINLSRRTEALIKSIKIFLARQYNHNKKPYHIYFHNSESNFYLQAADYCCWAIYKKYGDWKISSDLRPYNLVKRNIKSEFDIFSSGATYYY